mmetsp:Transcript_11809/g.15427  ORF Transcript_11809/g.15427 Transcript_11809/m.15427 type:complete len:152 (-) Transcript_11809:849-1304(-)
MLILLTCKLIIYVIIKACSTESYFPEMLFKKEAVALSTFLQLLPVIPLGEYLIQRPLVYEASAPPSCKLLTKVFVHSFNFPLEVYGSCHDSVKLSAFATDHWFFFARYMSTGAEARLEPRHCTRSGRGKDSMSLTIDWANSTVNSSPMFTG